MPERVRTRGALLIAFTVMAALLSGCDWTTYFQNNGHAGFGVGEDGFTPASAQNLRLAWQASDGGQYHGVFSQPVVSNGNVYWGSFDGYERATDTSGHLVWQTFLGLTVGGTDCDPYEAGVASTATIRSDQPVGSASSVLYVGGGNSRVYALNADTGAVLWSRSVGSNPQHFVWSSPAVFGNSVYIGVASYGDCPLVQGQVLQLDRTTGAVQHTFNVVPNGCTGGGVWGTPTIDEAAGTLYVATGNGGDCASNEPLTESLVELRTSDLSLAGWWAIPPQDQIFDSDFGTTPTLFNGVLDGHAYGLVGVINKNGTYYTFVRDALGFGPAWRVAISDAGVVPQEGTGDIASAAYDGNALYVGGEGGQVDGQTCTGSVSALNPSTGAFIWRHCFTDGFVLGGVTGASGGVIAVGEGNNISVLSTATGASAFTFTGTGPFFGPPSIANGALYEGDMSGNLYALSMQ